MDSAESTFDVSATVFSPARTVASPGLLPELPGALLQAETRDARTPRQRVLVCRVVNLDMYASSFEWGLPWFRVGSLAKAALVPRPPAPISREKRDNRAFFDRSDRPGAVTLTPPEDSLPSHPRRRSRTSEAVAAGSTDRARRNAPRRRRFHSPEA